MALAYGFDCVFIAMTCKIGFNGYDFSHVPYRQVYVCALLFLSILGP